MKNFSEIISKTSKKEQVLYYSNIFIIITIEFDFEQLKLTEMITMFQNKVEENPLVFDNFSQLTQIHDQLQANLKKLSFSFMTPIQKYSIHHISEGFDLMGCAYTGSGKTIAFLLPIVNKMLHEGPPNDSGKLLYLIFRYKIWMFGASSFDYCPN